jgi:regulator of nucleoside diphosphate kinase
MHHNYPTILSSNDYARLQGLMCTMIGSRTPFASLLRRKLGSAIIMLPTDAGPDLVSIGRRVRFSIDRDQADERTLVWEPPPRGDTAKLSLWQPRGLALLGLSMGQSIAYETAGGRTEFLEVEEVFPDDDSTEVAGRLPARLAGVFPASEPAPAT